MLGIRTLTHRLGALYLFVALLVVGVCAAAILQLRMIRLDTQRLVEESREQSAAAGLVTGIESLEALLRQGTAIDPEELVRGRELVSLALAELRALEGGQPGDPSRPEHQEKEEVFADRIDEALERVEALLAPERRPEDESAALALLVEARSDTEHLRAEAREETRESYRDVTRRARTTRTFLGLTGLGALLLLSVALLLFHRGVIRPIRRLRRGAERLGHGDRTHRIPVESQDEIGDLATSFNAMADRLQRFHDDLEERVRTKTSEFIRAARLADLGILASGIAHELNTPLASIAASAEGLQRRLNRGEVSPQELQDYSRVITQETLRARDITTRMLALVRQQSGEVSRVSLRLVAEQTVSALGHRAERRGVEVVADLPQDEFVDVEAGELIQVLVNLLANAIDASEPGTRVELRMAVRDDEILIDVKDRGSGIPEEDMERIFEPFFSTKSPVNGTGLGLALVARMVASRRGEVSVRSELGSGTTFHVTLPTDWRRNGT